MTTTAPTSKSATSVYQQLRTHPVDLKLTDAAEALPRVLDEAQAEGWTLTTALDTSSPSRSPRPTRAASPAGSGSRTSPPGPPSTTST